MKKILMVVESSDEVEMILKMNFRVLDPKGRRNVSSTMSSSSLTAMSSLVRLLGDDIIREAESLASTCPSVSTLQQRRPEQLIGCESSSQLIVSSVKTKKRTGEEETHS
ncbi:hypothetical protein VZT92_006882 [Zoarces viviparus]|uniref:Uncharacterized protein n=1 Tax=Zoarces viviparus TaxID=48416 RepID=A0AAW1FHZ3_ZOAVI